MKKFLEDKYSIGKQFRKIKNISKPDKDAKPIEVSQQLKEYIEYLKQNGLEFKKLQVAQFKTKNGLPFTGLIATEKLLSNEIFMKIPRKSLLTTRNCFFSDVQQIFEQNPWFYSNYVYSWEDNIFWTFLLYENQKGSDSQWYLLLKNLPKDIDYLIFWTKEELSLLEDQELIKQASKMRKDFENDYKNLVKVLQRYPQFFKPDAYSYENAKWIYCHITSRCFGKYLENITMVPFVELLNHECVDVYYDFMYENGNPYKSQESVFDPPTDKSQQQLEQMKTSDCSNNSEFYDEKDNYIEKVEITEKNKAQSEEPIIATQGSSIQLNEDLSKEINSKIQQLELFIYNNINIGDSFSIYFASQVYEKLNLLKKQTTEKSVHYFEIQQELKSLDILVLKYKEEIQKYYKQVLKKNIQKIQQKIKLHFESDEDAESSFKPNNKNEKFFPSKEEWKADKFDWFVMKCAQSQIYEPGAQIFFCYGRISNRLLLLRYGFALEYNKYDSLHLSLEFINTLDKYKIIKEKLNEWKNICKFKYFKIKRTKFNVDILFWVRNQKNDILTKNFSLECWFWVTDLDLEVECIEETIKIYEEFLQKTFSKTLEENEKLLYDKSLGYHQYFSTVYRIERQKIIKKQINLLKIVKDIFQRMKQNNTTLEEEVSKNIPELETKDDFYTNRQLLVPYFDRVQLQPQHQNQ